MTNRSLIMPLAMAWITSICVPAILAAQVEIGAFHDTLVVRKSIITITITAIRFSPEGHRIDSSDAFTSPGSYIMQKIDGRTIHGTDGEMPRTAIGRFEVKWDGQPVKIPKSLYCDCFEPAYYHSGTFRGGISPIVASEDGKRILIQMDASDCAGSYTVWWIISKDGNHSRFIGGGC